MTDERNDMRDDWSSEEPDHDSDQQALTVMGNMAMLKPASVKILTPMKTEYVYYSLDQFRRDRPGKVGRQPPSKDDHYMCYVGFVSMWNEWWEAGMLRGELYAKTHRESQLPPAFAPLAEDGNTRDVTILPQIGRSRAAAWMPFLHLVPLGILRRFGLPTSLSWGHYPWNALGPMGRRNDELSYERLTRDFNDRLGRALASYIWPLLSPASGRGAFARTDPLVLLAHNLDYWLPFLDRVIKQRMESHVGRIPVDELENPKALTAITFLEGCPPAEVVPPFTGGAIWWGEDEAWDVAKAMVDEADRDGGLRALIDAFRSHRVQDDFSPRWSRAREDFERKLYSKRSKIGVRFVELDDQIPVIASTTDVMENHLWDDLIALMDHKEREVVVLLRHGETKVSDIAKALGYANHSPVSKTLARIRKKAKAYFS